MIPRLIIFAGKPGVGKSTLIKKLFSQHTTLDVLKFIRAYQVEGKIQEERTLLGYQDMYEYISGLNNSELVVEIGTNHAEFNIQELSKLKEKYRVHLFLCDVSKETAYARLVMRLEPDRDIKEIQERLNRDFPNSFLTVLKNSSLRHSILDMEKDIEEISKKVLAVLQSK